MKYKYTIPFLLLLLGLSSCFDASSIHDQLNDHESRLTKLETFCNKINSNIISLQSICDAFQKEESISHIVDIVDEGQVIGYNITFRSGKTITLYHGLNGIDGQNSIIGVALDDDGFYYWTINGSWILDGDGNKLHVTGQDGISPKLKIEGESWFVSYDDGVTWDSLGIIQVDNGECACIFDSITITDTDVIFRLIDGTSFKLQISIIDAEEYTLKLGCDYEAISGGINVLGMPIEGDNYWHSTPIQVSYGDIVEVITKYQGAGMVIAQTDIDNSYFRVLCIHDNTLKYRANIDFSGYISISYIKDLEPIEFKITSSKELQTAGIAINSADISSVKNIVRDSDNRRANTYISFESESRSAYNNAKFEHKKMLEEIAKMTSDEILVSGICGYNKDGNVIEEGTISWAIYKGGILHIKGYGRMYDFIKGASSCMNINEVNEYVEKLGSSYWYYGFVAQNENNITPPFNMEGQTYLTDEIMSYEDKRYVPWGDDINPVNGKPYGYAAPWYIYRTHVDDNYTSLSSYLKYNPQRITYNRVCIEEDVEKGGITYLGNWAFYRVSAQSLILPNSVTSLGCWCIRYSSVLDTIVMGDEITHIEDHGISRLESLRYIKLSDNLVSIGYAGMENCPILEYLSCPSSLSNLGAYTFNGCNSLSYSDFGSVIEIKKSLVTHGALVSLMIPDNVKSIAEDAFYGNRLEMLRIPSNVGNIENNAFRDNKSMKVVIVDSQAILQKLKILNGSSADLLQQGAILAYCDWLVIPIDSYVPLIHKNFLCIGEDEKYLYFRRVVEKLNS